MKLRLEWSINGRPYWLEWNKYDPDTYESARSFKYGLEASGHPVVLYRLFEL